MIDPLKTQIDDGFINFDFSIKRLVYSVQQLPNLVFNSQLMMAAPVPNPVLSRCLRWPLPDSGPDGDTASTVARYHCSEQEGIRGLSIKKASVLG